MDAGSGIIGPRTRGPLSLSTHGLVFGPLRCPSFPFYADIIKLKPARKVNT
ncbi:hypothetical protein OIU92_27310 [Escherichia coli]|nr:hypothetical protein [Escherichia coli]